LGEVLNARLAPDMISFGEQFAVTCNKVEHHMTKLLRQEPGPAKTVPMDYTSLKSRLAETRAFLRKLTPEGLAGAETHAFELSPPIARGWFGGPDYILLLVIPDFFFHLATAHGILRHLGAPVGKRTYLGNLSQESGGAYS
jgi:hypothetical protein